jgi:ABC-type hemin transport system substrate-binding protein
LLSVALLGLLGLLVISGCEQPEPPPPRGIASTSPAVTDILLQLDATDALVAVSRFDGLDLPHAGDALAIDWETLAAVRPAFLAIGTDIERLSASDRQRAEELGIEWIDARIVRLDDVRRLVGTLAATAGLSERAAREAYAEELGRSRSTSSPLRVLVLLDGDFTFAAGRNNYIDDLIHHAGGVNAVGDDLADWPTLNEEALAALEVDRVVVLLPDAADRQVEEARDRWSRVAGDVGIPWQDVRVVTESRIMTPGWTGTTQLAAVLREMAR